MITGELKNRIDSLWTDFWTGGITNPLTVIEQITFLMYSRLLDMQERRDEKRATIQRRFEYHRRFLDDEQDCRWETWRHFGAEPMLAHVRDKVIPHFRRLAERSAGMGSTFAGFMKDAQLMIQKPSLLVKAVNAVHALPLEHGDTKGDLYEYLLSKLTTAGINGQFRTPRHIIRLMVELMQPQPMDRLCDPACGTAGFLVESYEYLLRQHTSEAGRHVEMVDGQEQVTYSGDLLEAEHRKHIDEDMFHAFDFDATMLRIASMNLVMHGVREPDVHYQDTLSQRFEERFPDAAANAFDLVLANPPFKGSLDEHDVAPDLLRTVKTKKTELLFIALILRLLKVGGRSATIVPDGVLFGSSKAHVQLRQQLIENNQLEAVISLPSGVFKPYAGVSTAIIIFTKGGRTENVFFYDVQSDGYTLDDKRTQIGDGKGDLPDVLAKYLLWCDGKGSFADRTAKAFNVPASEIAAQSFDLAINRYKAEKRIAMECDSPQELLRKPQKLEEEIGVDLADLEGLLK